MSLSAFVALVVVSQTAPDFLDAQAFSGGSRVLAAGGWLYQGAGGRFDLVGSLDGPVAALAGCSEARTVAVGRAGSVRVVDSTAVVYSHAVAPAVDLWAVAAEGCEDVVFVGEGGALWQGSAGREPTFRAVASPTRNSLYGVAVRGGMAVAVGAGGAIIWRPGRSGAEWKVLRSPTEAPLLSVAFAGKAWLVAGAGGLWRAEGQDLVQVHQAPAEIFTRLVFFDERIGIALGQQTVLVTLDGGRTWSTRNDEAGWLAAVPSSAQTFLLLGRAGRIGFLDVSPEPDRPGKSLVTRLPDARVKPKPKPKEQPAPVEPMVAAQAPEWLPLPTLAMPPAPEKCRQPASKEGISGAGFVDVKRAAAGLVLAGADGTLRRLVLGKPEVVATPGVPMLGLAVSSDRQQVAAVGFGSMAFSANAGKSFVIEPSPNSATFFAVTFAGQTRLAFDDAGRGFRREPQGSWKPLALPRAVTFYTAFFEDDRHGYLVGECSTLLATEDSGASWVALPAPMDSPQGVLASRNTLYVAGFEGVFRSVDRGRHFERVLEAKGCIRLTQEQEAIAVACNDVGQPLWISTRGLPFVKVQLDQVVHQLLSVAFDEGGDLVAVGPGDLIIRARGLVGRVELDTPASREALSRALWLFNELRKEERARPVTTIAQTRPKTP